MKQSLWLRLGPLAFAGVLLSGSAHARLNNAQFTGCNGCHGNTAGAELSVELDPAAPDPGDQVRMLITVTGPGIQIGGFSVYDEDGTGLFSVPAGQAVAVVNPQWAFHSSAQPVNGASVQYQVDWQAPSTPGAANFLISAVAGNGNGQNSGDRFVETTLRFSFGCAGATYYFDGDGDGAGDSPLETKLGCEQPVGYAPQVDDCDTNDENIHPGAPERCNGRDDDCDGEVDEGLEFVPRYPDEDGDGYGSANGEPVMGCAAPAGYADTADDCDDNLMAVNPGAMERCDFYDNDCDGQVDDGALETCGVGSCARESESCLAECVPGDPIREICDGFDNDCDGETDEADACSSGQVCSGFTCVDAASAAESGPSAGIAPEPTPTPASGAPPVAVPAPSPPPAIAQREPAPAAAASTSGCQFGATRNAWVWMLALGSAMVLRRRRTSRSGERLLSERL